MGDLSRSGCGCGCDNGCGNSGIFGGSSCCSLIWIILLLSCFCGNGNGLLGNNGCGCDNGCGNDSCLWIILLLLFCGNGFNGNGCSSCGCNSCGCNSCGC